MSLLTFLFTFNKSRQIIIDIIKMASLQLEKFNLFRKSHSKSDLLTPNHTYETYAFRLDNNLSPLTVRLNYSRNKIDNYRKTI